MSLKITTLSENTAGLGNYLGEWGFSVLVETDGLAVLVDAGQSLSAAHNADLLGVDLGRLDRIMLSHGHYDHTGGLVALLPLHPGLPIYAHPGILRERFARQGEKLCSIGLPMDANLLREQAHLHLSREPQEIGPGVWTTGEIGARTEPEGRGEGHSIREGESWIPDPYEDDMALVLQGTEGLVLLCGCCHAGLLNTLHHVQRAFGDYPKVIIGGTHLVAADEQHIRHVAGRLQQMGFSALYPNHCTGQAAYVALAMALGSRVSPYPAGSVLTV